jgi:hypothetical protein
VRHGVLKARLSQHLVLGVVALRIGDATSTVVAAIGLLVGLLIITITDIYLCRSIIDRSKSYHGFDTGSLLLLCLTVIVGVVEDDYLAVTRRPEDIAVEITKKLSAEFLITRSINNERGMVDHWGLLRGVDLLEHW